MSGTLLVADPDAAPRAEETLWSWISRADRAVNRFLPTSEISRLNKNGHLEGASDDFLTFVRAGLDVAALTQGLCDPTVYRAVMAWGYDRDFDQLNSVTVVADGASRPSCGVASIVVHGRDVVSPCGLDLGASAKAVVVDAIADALEPLSDVLVEIGGDVAVRTRPGGEAWTIGVAPDGPDSSAPRIDVRGGGVATSSRTHRSWLTSQGPAHHIIDPRTGRPATSQWTSITVAAPRCLYANALATAGFLWDDDAPWHIGQTGWAGRLVRDDGAVVTVGSWPQEDA